jgi:hypothetical protein
MPSFVFATTASNLTLIFIGFWRFLFDYEKASYRARIRFVHAPQKAKYIWFLWFVLGALCGLNFIKIDRPSIMIKNYQISRYFLQK